MALRSRHMEVPLQAASGSEWRQVGDVLSAMMSSIQVTKRRRKPSRGRKQPGFAEHRFEDWEKPPASPGRKASALQRTTYSPSRHRIAWYCVAMPERRARLPP